MIVAIIPARGGSKRLPRKNVKKIHGKPMIQWAIDACKKSKYIGMISVSSEDEEILQIANKSHVNTIRRPKKLAEDHVWTQEVLKHAVEHIRATTSEDVSVIVRVQANSPQVTCEKIDSCIEKLIKNNLWEVFTVDSEGLEDGAIHIMKAECVYQEALSVYKGVVQTNYIDIHTEEDFQKVKKILEKND